MGFYPEIYFSEIVNDRKIFNEIIYIFIESGIPFVAGLRAKRHAIAITGHLKIEHEKDDTDCITPVSDLIKGYFSVDDIKKYCGSLSYSSMCVRDWINKRLAFILNQLRNHSAALCLYSSMEEELVWLLTLLF